MAPDGGSGLKDSKGRIWFCGRKAHRVETEKRRCSPSRWRQYSTIMKRSTAVRSQASALKIVKFPWCLWNLLKKFPMKKQFIRELSDLAGKNPLTAGIEYIFIDYKFPVDIRHNSKIFREKLAIKARELINRVTAMKCRPGYFFIQFWP